MKISVYQTFNGYCVVAGLHRKAARAFEHSTTRSYENAAIAFATETDTRIRASILRIDPTASDGSTPATQHHVNLKPSVTDTNQEQRRMYRAQSVIDKARRDGVTIDTGNVVDLLCDNLTGWTTSDCRYIARKLGYGVTS